MYFFKLVKSLCNRAGTHPLKRTGSAGDTAPAPASLRTAVVKGLGWKVKERKLPSLLQARGYFTQKQELTKMNLLPTMSGCAGRETEPSLWPHPQDTLSQQRKGTEPRKRGETQPQHIVTPPFLREDNQAS